MKFDHKTSLLFFYGLMEKPGSQWPLSSFLTIDYEENLSWSWSVPEPLPQKMKKVKSHYRNDYEAWR